MSAEGIESNSNFSDPEQTSANFSEGSGEMTPTADATSPQSEMPPSPTRGAEEMSSNLEGASENYGSRMTSAGPSNQDWMPEKGELSNSGQFSGEAAPSGDAAAPPFGDAGAAPSGDTGAAPSGDTGTAPSGDAGAAPPGDAGTVEPAGDEGNGAADGEVTYQELRDNPELLRDAGIDGLEVNDLELALDSNGMLSKASKEEVNELVGYLNDALGGIEVVANNYVADNDNVGTHITSGDNNSVSYYPMEGTVYSVHTHPGGSTTPSQTDLDNELPGAEDAIVPADGIAGNEDGSNYYVYAEDEEKDGQNVASEVSEANTDNSSETVTLDG